MRIILIISITILLCPGKLYAQYDFVELDKQTYDYYINNDYRNLKKTGEEMISKGMDYYWLRMRLGISGYNHDQYSAASGHFRKALEFNSIDTISREYLYYSYLLSGREADANLYLRTLSDEQKNYRLVSVPKPGMSALYSSFTYTGYNVILYESNSLYYEALKSTTFFNIGSESYFGKRYKGTFVYSNYRKTGTLYDASNPGGKPLDFSQNQFYDKFSCFIFPGWELYGFGHLVVYQESVPLGMPGMGTSQNDWVTESAAGLGVSKNGWKIRAGLNLSFSNFGNSKQTRAEGYLTWLPQSNLKLYLTSGGMFQADRNWVNTFQLNQEIGFKVVKRLWIEAGIANGNSFLYTRNQGYLMNNSYQIPAFTIYSKLIILAGKHVNLLLSPSLVKNYLYSWDLDAYTRTAKITTSSFGSTIRFIYKFR